MQHDPERKRGGFLDVPAGLAVTTEDTGLQAGFQQGRQELERTFQRTCMWPQRPSIEDMYVVTGTFTEGRYVLPRHLGNPK